MAGFNETFIANLNQMLAGAGEAGFDVGINSGYRTPDRQAEIISENMGKYGFSDQDRLAWQADVAAMGPEAAGDKWASQFSSSGMRKNIALPNKSQHQRGTAADLRYGSPDAQAWVHQNAANYGITFPMGHEPWHAELIGARTGGAPMATMPTQQPQPQPMQSQGDQMSPTGRVDPFADLSRSQRMMLGFAALRDAGESFSGRQSNYFNTTLSGFEQAKERERLRAQGDLANMAAMAQSIAMLDQQIATARALGQDVSMLMATRNALQASLPQGYGAMAAPAAPASSVGAPVATGGVPVSTPVVTAGPITEGAPAAARAFDPAMGAAMDFKQIQAIAYDESIPASDRADALRAFGLAKSALLPDQSKMAISIADSLEAKAAAAKEAADVQAAEFDTALNTINTIDEIVTNPALPEYFSLGGRIATTPAGKFFGIKPEVQNIDADLSRLKGLNFRKVFEDLKGAGSITETESAKAEQSLLDMGNAQTADNFLAAVLQFREATAAALQRGGVEVPALPDTAWRPAGTEGAAVSAADYFK